jgi:hypothetical protein
MRVVWLELVDGLHGREQNDVPDACRIGDQHDDTVNADAQSAGGGHAVLERIDEISSIDALSIAAIQLGLLPFEPLMIDWIVEF